MQNRQLLLAVSLDCSGAFDNISFVSARRNMERRKVPENIIRWYCNLLKDRHVKATVQGKEVLIKPSRGSPQGGVLSPLVWNIIIDEILQVFKEGPVKVIGYADDILLYITGKNPITMGEILQSSLDKVVKWGNDNGLSFNPNKTTAVMFRKYSRNLVYPTLTMGGVVVDFKDSFKYLGIEIHKNLNWLPHVKQRTEKCNSLLSKCRNIVGRSWGLNPDKMEWILKAVIQPKVSYGSVIWAGAQSQAVKAKLTRTQRLGLLSIIHPLRSAPTAGLEAMMGWLPLPILVEKAGFSTYLRIKHMIPQGWDGAGCFKEVRGHMGIWRKREFQLLQGPYPTAESVNKLVWEREGTSPLRKIEDTIYIFTDASKCEENVGYAWAAFVGDYAIQTSICSAKEMEVHQAEQMAIREALSWIKEIDSLPHAYVILSDSQSAVKATYSHEVKDSLTLEIKHLINSIKCPIKIGWVRGHANNTGNEYADSLAREGAEEAKLISYSSPFVPISCGRLKKLTQEGFESYWQEIWSALPMHRVSKLFLPEVSIRRKSLKMSSAELQLLSQIITGHGLFKRHLWHWNDISDIACSLCGEADEDSWHLWKYCPGLTEERTDISFLIKRGLPWYGALIKFFKTDKLKSLFASNEAFLVPDAGMRDS